MNISLIIPAHNEEKEIKHCLNSVFKNNDGLFSEIIVVDNASTDRTAEIAGEFKGVKLVKEERKGTGFARQKGFESARGDILAFVDADTRMPAGWFGKAEKAFREDKKLACLSGPYLYYDLPLAEQLLIEFLTWFVLLPGYFLFGTGIISGNFVIRRGVLEKMGGFDTTIKFYGDDTDIAQRARQFGKVKFSMKLRIPSSGRRFRDQGLIKTLYLYVANFLSVTFFKRPVS